MPGQRRLSLPSFRTEDELAAWVLDQLAPSDEHSFDTRHFTGWAAQAVDYTETSANRKPTDRGEPDDTDQLRETPVLTDRSRRRRSTSGRCVRA